MELQSLIYFLKPKTQKAVANPTPTCKIHTQKQYTMNGKITTAATILLLLAATGVEAQNTFLCKIPANYVAAPTTKGPIGQNPGNCGWSRHRCCFGCCFC